MYLYSLRTYRKSLPREYWNYYWNSTSRSKINTVFGHKLCWGLPFEKDSILRGNESGKIHNWHSLIEADIWWANPLEHNLGLGKLVLNGHLLLWITNIKFLTVVSQITSTAHLHVSRSWCFIIVCYCTRPITDICLIFNSFLVECWQVKHWFATMVFVKSRLS